MQVVKRKKGWDDPDYYIQQIKALESKGSMTVQLFAQIVNEYLISFKDCASAGEELVEIRKESSKVTVKWTPEHIKEDLDLIEAIKLINTKGK